jgi:hypothetical protein
MNDVGSLPRASLLIRHRDSCGIGVGHYLRFSRCVRYVRFGRLVRCVR